MDDCWMDGDDQCRRRSAPIFLKRFLLNSADQAAQRRSVTLEKAREKEENGVDFGGSVLSRFVSLALQLPAGCFVWKGILSRTGLSEEEEAWLYWFPTGEQLAEFEAQAPDDPGAELIACARERRKKKASGYLEDNELKAIGPCCGKSMAGKGVSDDRNFFGFDDGNTVRRLVGGQNQAKELPCEEIESTNVAEADREGGEYAMGSGVSHLAGCFIHTRDGSTDAGVAFQYSEDEGLGHSFCYVRPPHLGLTPLISPEQSDEFPCTNGKNPYGFVASQDALVHPADLSGPLKDDKAAPSCTDRCKTASERSNIQTDKTKGAITTDKPKNGTETCFKSISGASVSANTATPRTLLLCEQFNSLSNSLYDRAAAFASSSSFSALPLQPVPRGFSGPLSGPLDRGFVSGPIERGFMSGPLERGFMSGPLERGCMSGPLDPADRSHFSAPLNGRYHYQTGYLRKRRKALARFMRSMSGPMKKALARTANSLVKTQRSIVAPVKSYVFREGKEVKDSGEESSKPTAKLDDFPDNVCYTTSSELDSGEGDSLQWAQGKAGEDRVHLVVSEEHGWLFVGIYDGFNGPDAPDFLMSNLYPAVSQELRGLLWDTKEEECTSSADADPDCEWEVVGERQADGGETVAADEAAEHRKNRNYREGGRRRGIGVVKVGHNRRWTRRVPARSNGKDSLYREHDLQDCSQDLPVDGHLEECVRSCADEIQSSGSCCSTQLGISQSGNAKSPLEFEKNLAGLRDEAVSPVSMLESGGRSPERLDLEQERSLSEDRTVRDDEEKAGLSSEKQESTSQSASHGKDQGLQRRRLSGFKLRHGHERRKEQLRRYFKWRCEQEKQGTVHKVHSAKVGQEPDVSLEEKGGNHAAILKALARALQTTENAYLDMADSALFENPELALMGSCVLVMVMKDEDVYILNVGDSRAVLAQQPKAGIARGKRSKFVTHGSDSGSRDSLGRVELERIIEETPMELEACVSAQENRRIGGPPRCCKGSLLGAIQLTTDHSTSIREEVMRLKSEHSDVDTIHNDRVKGRLKVTRAFGAGFLKQPKWNNALLEMFRVNFIGTAPYITCNPALYHHRLGPQDQFLVLSSDGLYQYLSNEEVVSHVELFMEKYPDGDPAQHLIEELLFRAAKKAGMDFHELLDIPQGDRRKYHDDVSVIVISLEGRIWRSSGHDCHLELQNVQEPSVEVHKQQEDQADKELLNRPRILEGTRKFEPWTRLVPHCFAEVMV
ncbi:hypothetical protein R1sor_019864 [Riccia sorocarpa]|uniref:PPM-type phosphatase domain-containing protein n=1 Tax=Riccia sorocarpa TaxID=122646 RepID=A0ABD3IGG0_9MARC